MSMFVVEFDDAGHAADELAQLWLDASPGERSRITTASHDVEKALEQNPQLGTLVTNGPYPPVRYVDWDILRVFHTYDPNRKNVVTIIGFKKNP
jgi:hypothetical protein